MTFENASPRFQKKPHGHRASKNAKNVDNVGNRSSVLGFVAAVVMVDNLPYDLIGLHPRRPCASAFVGDFSDFAPTRLVERMADIPGGALRQKQRERGRHSNPNPNQNGTRPSPNLFLMDYPQKNFNQNVIETTKLGTTPWPQINTKLVRY